MTIDTRSFGISFNFDKDTFTTLLAFIMEKEYASQEELEADLKIAVNLSVKWDEIVKVSTPTQEYTEYPIWQKTWVDPVYNTSIKDCMACDAVHGEELGYGGFGNGNVTTNGI